MPLPYVVTALPPALLSPLAGKLVERAPAVPKAPVGGGASAPPASKMTNVGKVLTGAIGKDDKSCSIQ